MKKISITENFCTPGGNDLFGSLYENESSLKKEVIPSLFAFF